MNPAQLRELELMCDASLPEPFLALMSSFPESLQRAERADPGEPCDGLVSEVELLANLSDLVMINREVRSQSIPDPDGNDFRWPDQLLVIGETGDGDYYCLDVDGEHPGVLQFRHQIVDFEIIADSLQEFIDLLIESYVTERLAE